MYKNISDKVKHFSKSIQRVKSLQALSSITQFRFPFLYILKCIKRVSFQLSVSLKASVSIEAAISIPVFLFCFLEILSLLNYLSVYSGVLYAIKTAAEPITIYSYAYEELKSKEQEVSVGEELFDSIIFSEGYLDRQIHKLCEGKLFEKTIKGGSEGIHVLGSQVDSTEKCVDIIAYYMVKPLIGIGSGEEFLVNHYYTRLWTGYMPQSVELQEEYVYVTDNGSVYHVSDACTHLKLSISNVKKEEIVNLRNDSGGKYSGCEKCCQGSSSVEIYYITKQGDKYHEKIACSGLKRTIYCVSKKEVENIPVCSRCGKDGGG